MKLENLLAQKRATILGRWFDLIVETYPAETAKFLKRQQDTFANPVGAAIHQGIEGVFAELAEDNIDRQRVSPFLDRIVRVRAIQEFSPSQAVAFMFSLKEVIRQELTPDLDDGDELVALNYKIDALALVAFDIYMQCREELFKIKTDEVRRLSYNLLRQAKLVCENQEEPCVDPNSTT